ncbi:hypothetical protein J6590_043663 [Homalodisca vitripennis]|nr:hypothetical protein J6590_043663 [Homalodisca vitripennis]
MYFRGHERFLNGIVVGYCSSFYPKNCYDLAYPSLDHPLVEGHGHIGILGHQIEPHAHTIELDLAYGEDEVSRKLSNLQINQRNTRYIVLSDRIR